MGMSTPPATPTARRCRRLRIPDEQAWIACFNGVLAEMLNKRFWTQVTDTDLTPEQAAAIAQQVFFEYMDDGDNFCMAGEIFAWVAPTPPNNALLCDGSEYPKVQYPYLAALMPEGSTPAVFVVPDMRAKFLLGAGVYFRENIDDAEIINVNETRGGDSLTYIAENQLPSHSHTTQPHSHADAGHTHSEGNAIPIATTIGLEPPEPSAVPGIGITGVGFANIQPSGVTVNPTGGGQPLYIMPGFYGVNWYIHTR